MKKIKSLVLDICFVFVLGILSQCRTQNKTTEDNFTLMIQPVIGTNTLAINTYYPLQGQDSILITKLDFYIQNPSFVGTTDSVASSKIMLYSIENNRNSQTFSCAIPNGNQTNFNFLIGLNSTANATNPTSVSSSDPLSNSMGMYWTAWTKYRYIILEGYYKKGDGTTIPMTYHTGLSYLCYISIDSISYQSTINLKLHIDDIFLGQNTPILVANGESATHSTASEDAITTKFVRNFSYALRKN